MKFSFTGTFGCTSADSKRPYLRTGKTKSGAEYKTLTFYIQAGDNNRGFVELFGSDQSKGGIRTKDTEGKDLEIDWADRFDDAKISAVANYRKHLIRLENGDRGEFIADLDAVNYILENMSEISGKRFTVTGTVQREVYRGSVRNRFTLGNMYPAAEGAKDGLLVTTVLYFSADDIDTADWKSERMIIVNGYTQEYIDKDHGRMYLSSGPLQVDCSKVNPEKKSHLMKQQLHLAQLGVNIDGKDNAKIVLKKNKIYANEVVLNYINGNETKEFDESMLTPTQKSFVDAGLKTLDDYRPRGQAYGNRVELMRISDFTLLGDYVDGLMETDLIPREFEEEIYRFEAPADDEKDELEKAMNAPETAPFDESDDEEEDLTDLFS